MSARGLRLFLALVVLFLGGSGLVYEYCLSTLASHLLGNSIEQFSLIIALMLFAMGLAGLAQRAVRRPEAVAEVFVAAEIGLGLLGGSSAFVLYAAFAWLDHFHLALYSLALAIGFGIGLEIPMLMRLNQEWRPDLRDNVADVFSLDYVGALLGALLWAFVLLPWLPLDRIGLVLGLANLGIAGATLYVLRARLPRPGRMVAALVGAIACLATLAVTGDDLIDVSRQRLFRDPIQYHTQSPYQDIVVTGSGARMSLYLNGHLQFDTEDEHIYHEMLVHPALMSLDAPPRDVLVLGGGDGLAVREVLKWPSVRRVTLVDLDPAVVALARTYPPLVALNGGALQDARVEAREAAGVAPGPTEVVEKTPESPRPADRAEPARLAEVHVRTLDADAYLREHVGPFDALVADFPDPRSVDLAKLFSLELYLQVRQRLRPGGVLAVQAGSPYAQRRAFWSVHDTLGAAGFEVTALHQHVPTFGEWGFLVARRDGAPDPVGAPPVPTRWLTAEALATSRLFPPHLARPEGPPVVSTRLAPRVLDLYVAGEPLVGPDLFPGRARR